MEYTYDVVLERNDLVVSFNFDTYEKALTWGKEHIKRNVDYTTITLIRFDENDEYVIMKTGNRTDW